MKRVLVTGASGFIGRHCLRPLAERGYEVHAVSRTPLPDDDSGATWHRADLLQPGAAAEVLKAAKPTHLLHLAWFVVPGQLITAPENFDWVKASFDLVRAFAGAGGTRMAVCGSGYEYDWNYGYCTEGLTPTTPDTVYGACKHALHEMARTFVLGKELSLVWPRVFFLYGPHEHPKRLVSSVILSLLKNEPALCSHGRQVRDYIHVQDVADGLAAVLDTDATGPVNVCSGEANTLREIVLTVGRLLERPELVRLGALPARANDLPLVVGSAERAKALGFKPRFDLEQGLAHTIEWWRKNRKD